MAEPKLDPIERIEWVPVAKLDASDWNPNYVFRPEMTLLRRNIVLHGWIQPILISRDFIIIDGFHRATLAKEDESLCRYGGCVPCVVMDIDRAEAIMLTVRMNRAKGTHVALRMSTLVQRLVDVEGASIEEIATGIGATSSEVELLYKGGVFKNRNLRDWKYSKAWVPVESTNGDDEAAIVFERDEATASNRID